MSLPTAEFAKARLGKKIKAARRTKAAERREALGLLGVDEDELFIVPKVEPLLREARMLDQVWDYLVLGREYDAAKRLLVKYEQLKACQLHKAVPFEAYCLSAKVVTLDALAVLTKVMKSHVDILTSSKKLGALHESTGEGATSKGELALLPAIEDDIRILSDRFNEQQLANLKTEPEDDEEEEE